MLGRGLRCSRRSQEWTRLLPCRACAASHASLRLSRRCSGSRPAHAVGFPSAPPARRIARACISPSASRASRLRVCGESAGAPVHQLGGVDGHPVHELAPCVHVHRGQLLDVGEGAEDAPAHGVVAAADALARAQHLLHMGVDQDEDVDVEEDQDEVAKSM